MDPSAPQDPCKIFEENVLEVLGDLYSTALRLMRNPTDAEDLVADSVAKAWAARESLLEPSRFRGWIFRILMNTFISDRRAKAVRPVEEALNEEAVDEFSLFERLHQPFLLWWGNPERAFLDRLLREEVERAVEELPDAFRGVVVLVELQGFSYQEVAETLEVPVGTVRSRLARGRALLQKSLWEHARDAGLVHERTLPAPKRAV